MKLATLCLLSLIGIAVNGGCVDTSPIEFEPPLVEAGSSLTDAALHGEAGLIAQCRECVVETTCSAEYQACKADARCGIIVECLIDSYCFNFDFSNLSNLKPCLLECAIKAGILSAEDPSTALFAPLIRCGQFPTQCGPVCNVR